MSNGAVQQDYPLGMSGGHPGMPAGNCETETAYNEEAATAIPFGVMVMHGTTPDGVKLPAAVGDIAKLRGIVRHSHAHARSRETAAGDTMGDLSSSGLLPKASLDVGIEGLMYVTPEDVPTLASPVYVRVTATGDNPQRGAFRTDDDDGKAVKLYGAKWRTTPDSSGIATLKFDMDAHRAAQEAAAEE